MLKFVAMFIVSIDFKFQWKCFALCRRIFKQFWCFIHSCIILNLFSPTLIFPKTEELWNLLLICKKKNTRVKKKKKKPQRYHYLHLTSRNILHKIFQKKSGYTNTIWRQNATRLNGIVDVKRTYHSSWLSSKNPVTRVNLPWLQHSSAKWSSIASSSALCLGLLNVYLKIR